MSARRSKEVWWVLLLAVMSSAAVVADRPARADTASPVFRRWAILAATEIRETGVSDLLTAELTARSMGLVEREQLDAVTRELELAKLLGAEAASQRLRVGQLVKADALMLRSIVEHDKKQFVKLVISDCRYGSRLRLEHFPFAADRADKLASEIV